MTKLKKATFKELSGLVPREELEKIKKLHEKEGGFVLPQKELGDRDDSLIDIEIAFRRCKRVGVFD